MDSLKIQDVFEPYYAGRKRFAALRDKNLPAEAADADRKEAGKRLLRRLLADAKTETDSTTEH
ncbi:hypothetical protein OHD62_00640 [Mesorhizobium sp. YC-39]|uniref:hypothetical protein n=1 Tax=unclassified Mesorhizobium TaxID=325217 RepID=UPI0021E82BDE|nr:MULTISPECIES: hypothetical protein [unclassified Mesorhizobium]MCV3206734.1 hypothetical protein [Mesorhizobium sp. YC-2]MCV3226866.1 hypothetical protein [Mesorhizobium sp. YC-39]